MLYEGRVFLPRKLKFFSRAFVDERRGVGEISPPPSVWLALRTYVWGYMVCSLVRWYEGGEMVRFREVHSVKFLEKVLPI